MRRRKRPKFKNVRLLDEWNKQKEEEENPCGCWKMCGVKYEDKRVKALRKWSWVSVRISITLKWSELIRRMQFSDLIRLWKWAAASWHLSVGSAHCHLLPLRFADRTMPSLSSIVCKIVVRCPGRCTTGLGTDSRWMMMMVVDGENGEVDGRRVSDVRFPPNGRWLLKW